MYAIGIGLAFLGVEMVNEEQISLLLLIYFTWPLRKHAAYKQTTRGPMALGPFRGTRK